VEGGGSGGGGGYNVAKWRRCTFHNGSIGASGGALGGSARVETGSRISGLGVGFRFGVWGGGVEGVGVQG